MESPNLYPHTDDYVRFIRLGRLWIAIIKHPYRMCPHLKLDFEWMPKYMSSWGYVGKHKR